jgi:hypothetical protein
MPRYRSDGNEYAAMGDALHAEAEAEVDTGDIDELPPRLATLLRDLPTRHTEIVVAYDVATDTASIHPDIVKRGYPAASGPLVVWMTLDLVALSEDGPARRALVCDHKLFAAQGDPKKHGQLLTQALAVARAFGLDEVTIAISYLGTGWVDIATVDALDLDMHAERLRDLHETIGQLAKLPASELRPTPGPHCKHCPAFMGCPAQSATVAMMRAADAQERIEAMIPFADDDAAADAYRFLGQLKLLKDRLQDALAARARERAIPLGDGLAYGLVETRGSEKLDAAVVRAVVFDAYGPELADAVVELKTTKTRVNDVARVAKTRGFGVVVDGKLKKTIGAIEDDIIGVTRARGGVKRSQPGRKLAEFRISPALEAGTNPQGDAE